jgi:glycosyltransferase involved in cell wall biosynthesis
MATHGFRKLSILIAAYNEQATLRACVEAVLRAPLAEGLHRELVLVDDCSTDATWLIMQKLQAEHPDCIGIYRQPANLGKGAAIRRAIEHMSGDLAILQDADLEYDPNDYSRMLAPILDGRADVVFGSRFTGTERRVLYFWHTVLNKALTLLSNMVNDTNWTDMETCYKAFTANALKAIPLYSNRFGIEPELAAKVARNRFRMYEVPITYNGRGYDEGKKIGWRDGVAAGWFIFKYRFFSRYSDIGKSTLNALEHAPQFNRWMYETIKPWIGQRVVELGSGQGNLSAFLVKDRSALLTDYRDEYCQRLSHFWGVRRNVRVSRLDMTRREDYFAIEEFAPDSVVFLNVLEHIEDDRVVLRNLYDSVPPNSRLVILVPYDMSLYSQFDEDLGHFRRYAKGELEEKVEGAGFQVERSFFFNKPGRVAWFLFNTIGRRRSLTTTQLRIYNLLTPLFRLWDKAVPGAGLSVIVIAQRPHKEDCVSGPAGDCGLLAGS